MPLSGLYILLFTALGIAGLIMYLIRFYPKQLMPIGKRITIQTPEPDKYHNDCLHPCIRHIPEGFCGYNWWMVQSPYYKRDSSLENPILYFSKDVDIPVNWEPVALVRDTPQMGFNSDPALFYEKGKLWIFWREVGTPQCEQLGVKKATVGCFTKNGKKFSSIKVYLTDNCADEDKEQCPILIKRGSCYLFYAVHYQYQPIRQNKGIAIWEGTSLESPDFVYKATIRIKTTYTCDKWKQKWIGRKLIFIPKPQKHDIWHFDLFEYQQKLYMFSVAEWGDNIMLSVAEDYKNFKTLRKPLVNNHYSEQFLECRPYFYKPTAYITNKTLLLYYTINSNHGPNQNELHLTSKSWD
jgi:hypothetical protein